MKQSIQTKVIAAILLLGILLIGILTVVSNVFFSRVTEDQIMPLSRGSVRTLALNVQLHSYTYLSVANSLSSDPIIASLADREFTTTEEKEQAVYALNQLLSDTNYWERVAWPAQALLLCQDGTVLTNRSFSYGTFLDDVRQSIISDVY